MPTKYIQNIPQNKFITFEDNDVSTGHVAMSSTDIYTFPTRVDTLEELIQCIKAGGRKWNFPVFEVTDSDDYLRIFFECGLLLSIPLFNGYDPGVIDVKGIIDDIGYISQEIGNQYHRELFGVWGPKKISDKERYVLFEKGEQFLGHLYRYIKSLKESVEVRNIISFDGEDTSSGFVSVTSSKQRKIYKSVDNIVDEINRRLKEISPYDKMELRRETMNFIGGESEVLFLVFSNGVVLTLKSYNPDFIRDYGTGNKEVDDFLAGMENEVYGGLNFAANLTIEYVGYKLSREKAYDFLDSVIDPIFKGIIDEYEEERSLNESATKLINFDDTEDTSTGFVSVSKTYPIFKDLKSVIEKFDEFLRHYSLTIREIIKSNFGFILHLDSGMMLDCECLRPDDENEYRYIGETKPQMMKSSGNVGKFFRDLNYLAGMEDIPFWKPTRCTSFDMRYRMQNPQLFLQESKKLQPVLAEFCKLYGGHYLNTLNESVSKLINFDDEDVIDASTGFVSTTNELSKGMEDKVKSVFKYGGEELNVYILDEKRHNNDKFDFIGMVVFSGGIENKTNKSMDDIVVRQLAYAQTFMDIIEIIDRCEVKTYGKDKGVLEINADALKRNFPDIDILYPHMMLGEKETYTAPEYYSNPNRAKMRLNLRIMGSCAGIEFVMERLAFDNTQKNAMDYVKIEVIPTDGVPRHRSQFSRGIKGYSWTVLSADNITYILTEEVCEKYVGKELPLDISRDLCQGGIRDIRYKIDPMPWWNSEKDLNINIINNYDPIPQAKKSGQYNTYFLPDDYTLHIDIGEGRYPVMPEKVDESWYYGKDSLFGDLKQPVLNIRSTGKWEYDTIRLTLDINTSMFEVGNIDFQHWPFRDMWVNGEKIEYDEYNSYYPQDNFKRKVQKALRQGNTYVKRMKVKFPEEEPRDYAVKGRDF